MGHTAAIIPVRGGSRGIPRKNARLLAGKPLLFYSVEAALGAKSIDRVFVSTDDEELASLATRAGAEVLRRPAALADDKSTLDAVVADAVQHLAPAIETVVTLQATCPLLRSESIDQAVSTFRAEGRDTVLTVVDSRHLAWTRDEEGRFAPLYQARVNRQELPAAFRETGGVVVCSRALAAGGSRFGANVGVVEVGKKESLDIDDYFDWWLVEKSLQRRSIVFRVLGSRENGLGHCYRALTLADRLIDHDLSFVVEDREILAQELIASRCYPLQVVTAGAAIDAILARRPDLVIHDVLDTSAEDIGRLAAQGVRSISFEDRGPGAASAHAVINALFESPAGPSHAFFGARFCALRDEFYSLEPRAPRDEVERVLVLFGGTDPNNLTERVLSWLEEVPGNFEVTVVLGLGYPYQDRIETLAAESRRAVRVVVNSRIISGIMQNSDIAITSAGRTVFELASLGVPMIVIPQNDREMEHEFARASTGIIALDRSSQLTSDAFFAALQQLLDSQILRATLHRQLLAADIRSGIDRVLSIIDDVLKGKQ